MISRLISPLVAIALSVFPNSAAAQSVRPGASPQAMNPDPEVKRPIAARESVWIERLTWMEVRDALRAGKTTAIVATGGVEQNGPYLVTAKHNIILSATAESIARKLGNALVAPIVAFVPEGSIDPPTDSMRYPGTISVEESTYRALVRDIVRSLRSQGFREIILIGDSGGNQSGLRAVATDLDSRWIAEGTRVRYIAEYYDWPGRQKWLASQGYREIDEGIHDELAAESIMLAVDPDAVRMKERIAAGKFSINGIPLAPHKRTAAIGRRLVDHIADLTVAAIRRERGQ